MVKVEMPRAQWESILILLRDRIESEWPHKTNSYAADLVNEISNQVYSQEY